MDKSELSLLCLLVEAAISSPDKLDKVAGLVLAEGSSPTFKAAVEVVRGEIGGVSSSPPRKRGEKLGEAAKRLGKRSDEASKVVGDAIEWAMSNRPSRDAA